MHQYKLYIKIIEFNVIYNYVVDKNFVWDCLGDHGFITGSQPFLFVGHGPLRALPLKKTSKSKCTKVKVLLQFILEI